VNALPTVISAALEVAINQVLQLDPDSVARLPALQGKVIAIELRGLDLAFYLIPQADRLNLYGHFEGQPDTVLRGTPLALARMGVAKDAGDVLFAGDVEISGDVELGQQFRALLDQLDIDWEEHLSQFTGDLVAHKVGNLVRGAMDWGQKTLNTLGQDAAEYLQEESGDLPSRAEVEAFLAQVDTLRSDVDRLEARLQRLTTKKKADGEAE